MKIKLILITSMISLFVIAFIVGQCNKEDEQIVPEHSIESSEDSVASGFKENFEPTNETQSVIILDSTAIEIPRLISKLPEQILCRIGYTTSYNNETKNANWVAWHLTSEHTDGEWSRKGIPYIVDEEIEGPRQELSDWYGHNLPIDHGHMCPAGDNKWDEQAMIQSFLLSNMCPQNSSLNQGDWEELESRCRGWARHYGDVYITCGPIFYNDNYCTIGENAVGVPDAFFKVVLCLTKNPKALGFIYPNSGEHHKLSSYIHTVDEIESITGIDFFYNLPDDIEEKVESNANLNNW